MHLEVTITVRRIQAESYEQARKKAWAELTHSLIRRRILIGIGITDYGGFCRDCRTAKEADGTFTVTIP